MKNEETASRTALLTPALASGAVAEAGASPFPAPVPLAGAEPSNAQLGTRNAEDSNSELGTRNSELGSRELEFRAAEQLGGAIQCLERGDRRSARAHIQMAVELLNEAEIES